MEHTIERRDLGSIERLEEYWHNSVLTILDARDVDGAVVACYPEVPMYPTNHAADINVSEDKTQDLVNTVTEYFSSRGSPYTCFRISPITRPRGFTSLLEDNGFRRKSEESVMVFTGTPSEEKIDPEVSVREISESEIDIHNELLGKIFEMPIEWKEGLDRLILEWMRKGGKCYLAYVEEKPVGTCSLFSLTKTGGIFNVGTLKEYRRRGIGATLTTYAILNSINEGNDLHTLQTTRGGYAEHLYRKMGFEIDHTISYFVKSF